MSDTVAAAAPPVASTMHEARLRADTGGRTSLGHDTYEAGLGHDTYAVGEDGGGLGEIGVEESAVVAPAPLEIIGDTPSPPLQQTLQPPPHVPGEDRGSDCGECLEAVGGLLECLAEILQCMAS